MKKSSPNPNAQNHEHQAEFKIFLVGLSKDQGIKQLTAFFSNNYKSFLKVEMKRRNKRSGKITGYAFLSVSSKKDYDHIVGKEKFQLFGRSFFAKPYLKGDKLANFKQNVNKRRIFMFGLPSPLSDTELEIRLREVFGHLECAFVVENNQTRINGKGLGYATFDSPEAAQKAIRRGEFEMNGKYVRVVEFNKKGGSNYNGEGSFQDKSFGQENQDGNPKQNRDNHGSARMTPSLFPSSPEQHQADRSRFNHAQMKQQKGLFMNSNQLQFERQLEGHLPKKSFHNGQNLRTLDAIINTPAAEEGHHVDNLRINTPKSAENLKIYNLKTENHSLILEYEGRDWKRRAKLVRRRMKRKVKTA